MWAIAHESIHRTYNSPLMSRSFLLSAVCCILSFILPILILISIGYSWNKYKQVLIQPTIVYDNHQVTCLLSDGTTIYDSTFTNEPAPKSYQAFVSVSSLTNNGIAVSATFIPTNIVACSILIYFQTVLDNRLQSLLSVPLSFSRTTSSSIVTVTQSGSFIVKSFSFIPQSSILQNSQANYYANNTQNLIMIDTFSRLNSNNISMYVDLSRSETIYSASATSISYNALFEVPAQTFLQENSLLSNLRLFIPFFVYLFILFWMFMAEPVIGWMLSQKIYRAKISQPKFKKY